MLIFLKERFPYQLCFSLMFTTNRFLKLLWQVGLTLCYVKCWNLWIVYFWSFLKKGERERDHQQHDLLEQLFAVWGIDISKLESKLKPKHQSTSVQLYHLVLVYQSLESYLNPPPFFFPQLFSVWIVWSHILKWDLNESKAVRTN